MRLLTLQVKEYMARAEVIGAKLAAKEQSSVKSRSEEVGDRRATLRPRPVARTSSKRGSAGRAAKPEEPEQPCNPEELARRLEKLGEPFIELGDAFC